MAFSFKKFWSGLQIVPKTTSTADSKGDLEVISSTGKLGFHNGTSVSPVVTESHTATVINKTIIAANNTITTAASGNLSATELNAALAELDLDIGDVFSDLGAHIVDPIDAHDASAISNIPSGNLAATDQQAANNELQSDIDTRATSAQLTTHAGLTTGTHGVAGTIVGTSDSQTLTNKTIVVASNTITTAASGNLTATALNAALAELQTDIDTRALQSSLDTTNTTVSGKVTGPASATDEAIMRYDLTTGKLAQNSVVTITDAGVAAGLTGLTSSGTVTASGTLASTGSITESFSTDSATTGANATVSSPTTPVIRLTNASLTSIDLLASPVAGRVLTIVNATGNSININNDTGGTAANRILTGTKATLSLADEASIIVKYDSTESRWMVIGGTGSGGGASLDTVFQLTGVDVPLWSTGDNAAFLGGGAISGTFAANTATPFQGISSYKYTQAAGSLNDYMASPAQAVDLRFRGQECTLFFPFKYDGASNDIEVIFYDATNSAIIPSSVFIQKSTNISVFKTNVMIPSTCLSIRVGFQTRVLNSGKIFEFDSVQLSSDTTVYANISNITYWTSFTPTGSWVTNTTYAGFYRQVGENVEYQFKATASGAVTATTLTFNLPTGHVIDTTKLQVGNSFAMVVGSGTIWDNSAAGGFPAFVEYQGTTTQLGVMVSNAASTYASRAGLSSTVPVTIANLDTVTAYATVPIVGMTATNPNILTAPETFSTDTAALVYASSAAYTDVTLANAPVGTFITFTYAASGNVRTQTTTAPTQTTSSMNSNGIQLFTRAYNAGSTSSSPSVVAIQIGKGLKGVTKDIYKSSGKVTAGSIDSYQESSATLIGMVLKDYDEKSGVLVLDCGLAPVGTTTTHTIYYSDTTSQTSGYLVINASKNPALLGIGTTVAAARATNIAGTSIANTGTTKMALTDGGVATNLTVDTTNNRITATVTGVYEASAACLFASNLYAAGNISTMQLFKNGVFYSELGYYTTEVALTQLVKLAGASDLVSLAPNDYLEIFLSNNRTAGATPLSTTAGVNFFNVRKIGGIG